MIHYTYMVKYLCFWQFALKWFWLKTCKLWIPKIKTVFFQNENSFVFFQSKNSFLKQTKSRVCVYMMYLRNPPTILSFTFYLKINLIKTNLDTSLDLEALHLKSSHLLDLVQTWSNELDSSWVLDVVLMYKLLIQTVLAPKLVFKSFVEATHLLRSWS